MCAICYPCAMYGSESEYIYWLRNVCYLIFNNLICMYIHIHIYRVSQDVFLVLKYTEITQNTYVQS